MIVATKSHTYIRIIKINIYFRLHFSRE